MSKATEISRIAQLAGISDPGPGVGSSVYKTLFNGVCRRFGLATWGSMPAQAERIVRAAGLPYLSTFDSRGTPSGGGSTVTLQGLQQVRKAVQVLVERE